MPEIVIKSRCIKPAQALGLVRELSPKGLPPETQIIFLTARGNHYKGFATNGMGPYGRICAPWAKIFIPSKRRGGQVWRGVTSCKDMGYFGATTSTHEESLRFLIAHELRHCSNVNRSDSFQSERESDMRAIAMFRTGPSQ